MQQNSYHECMYVDLELLRHPSKCTGKTNELKSVRISMVLLWKADERYKKNQILFFINFLCKAQKERPCVCNALRALLALTLTSRCRRQGYMSVLSA